MLPDPKVMCPATGFAKSCRAIVAEMDCPKFVHISGANPNNGQSVEKAGCIDSFMHMLLIENSQQQRQTGAAVESMRNALVQIRGAELEEINAVRSVVSGAMKIIDGRAS
jgi:hypothetical protein